MDVHFQGGSTMAIHRAPFRALNKNWCQFYLLLCLCVFCTSVALAEEPTHLRVQGTGWNHLKIGSNSDNLWGPGINPAEGRTSLRLVLRNFGGVDWSRMLIAPQGDPARAVVIGDYLPNDDGPWFDITIPLSAFPANAFNGVSMMSVPFSNGSADFELGIARIEFVGGGDSSIWFGPENTTNVFESQWVVELIAGGADSGGDEQDNSGNDDVDSGESGECESHLRIDGSGGYSHFKIGNNPNSLWNPSLAPASNQTTLRLRLNNFSGADWSKLMVTPNGNPANGVTLGDYIVGNPDGWFDLDIPVSDFPANVWSSVSNMSVPFSNGAGAFELGVSAISFVEGSAPLPFQWLGGTVGIANVVESSWDFERVNGTDNCGGETAPDDLITFGDFAGTNVFVDTPAAPIDVFGQVRLYMPAYFFGSRAASAKDLAFNPADGFVADVDDTLRRINTGASDVMLTLEDNFPFLASNEWELPIPAGADSKAVSSWSDYREICVRFGFGYPIDAA